MREQRLAARLARRRHAEQAIVEAGGVGEQVAHADRLAEGVRHAEAAQVRVDVVVQPQLAALDELHRGGRSEELRDRRDTEERPLRVDRPAARDVGEAEAAGEHDLPPAHQHEHRARHVALGELGREEAGHEAVEVAGIREGRRAGGPRRRSARGGAREEARGEPGGREAEPHAREHTPAAAFATVRLGAAFATVRGVAIRSLPLLTALLLAVATAAQPLAPLRVFLSGVAYDLELAADPASRERGLSGRTAIEPRGGMLFAFPDDAPRTFWMRDCLVDIDIVFLDRSGRVVAAHRMRAEPARQPHESAEQYLLRLRHYPSLAPARFAVELRAGSLSQLGLSVGSRVDVTGIALPTQ